MSSEKEDGGGDSWPAVGSPLEQDNFPGGASGSTTNELSIWPDIASERASPSDMLGTPTNDHVVVSDVDVGEVLRGSIGAIRSLDCRDAMTSTSDISETRRRTRRQTVSDEERRQKHNEIEVRRRQRIKNCLDRLGELTGCAVNETRATVSATIDHIENMKAEASARPGHCSFLDAVSRRFPRHEVQELVVNLQESLSHRSGSDQSILPSSGTSDPIASLDEETVQLLLRLCKDVVRQGGDQSAFHFEPIISVPVPTLQSSTAVDETAFEVPVATIETSPRLESLASSATRPAQRLGADVSAAGSGGFPMPVHYELVFQNASVALAALNNNGVLLFANRLFNTLIGLSANAQSAATAASEYPASSSSPASSSAAAAIPMPQHPRDVLPSLLRLVSPKEAMSLACIIECLVQGIISSGNARVDIVTMSHPRTRFPALLNIIAVRDPWRAPNAQPDHLLAIVIPM